MLSREFLTERGYCCGHGCLMCPYEPKHKKDNTILKVINCFKEENNVIKKKLKEVSVEEGMAIATKLFQVLNKRKDGIGLAANQVGIDASVAVVNVREPLVLINPKIISKENPIAYYEGCLSYPKKPILTTRYRDIEVKTEQVEGSWLFSGVPTDGNTKGLWERGRQKERMNTERLLEAVCVQHEIDHLNGITIFDRRIPDGTYKAPKRIGRNELVTIKKGDAVKVLKYKKAEKFLNDNWTLQ